MNETEKREHLLKRLQEDAKAPVCLALSGGVDSALLAALIGGCAKKHGTKAYGVTFDTVLHPACDLPAAKKSAKESGLIHKVISINELEFADIRMNPKNRCYLCKKGLFQKLKEFSEEHQIHTVYEGTNQDDLSQYRPGFQAVKELGIQSPLADAGLTKAEIRKWAAELGISAAGRPSSPCMATRLPYGTKLDLLTLRKIEAAEEAVKALGFPVVRVRLHGDVARVEVEKKDIEKAAAQGAAIVRLLKSLDFKYVTLDLEGFRSGSMDL